MHSNNKDHPTQGQLTWEGKVGRQEKSEVRLLCRVDNVQCSATCNVAASTGVQCAPSLFFAECVQQVNRGLQIAARSAQSRVQHRARRRGPKLPLPLPLFPTPHQSPPPVARCRKVPGTSPPGPTSTTAAPLSLFPFFFLLPFSLFLLPATVLRHSFHISLPRLTHHSRRIDTDAMVNSPRTRVT